MNNKFRIFESSNIGKNLEIWGFWPENEGKNETTVMDFFSADRPHRIHDFWSRKEPRNHPLD